MEFQLHPDIGRDARVSEYARRSERDNRRRQLRVYVVDPSVTQASIPVSATLSIPYETMNGEASGTFFTVDMRTSSGVRFQTADFDDFSCVSENGFCPDPADARFHAQMTYATSMATYEIFRRALGRYFDIRGAVKGDRFGPLVLRPIGAAEANAWYDRDAGAITFGYFKSTGAESVPEGRFIFTSMSSDVIVHEVTHALLDSIKPYFAKPTNGHVLAFHEAFADIVAVFHRFRFREFARHIIDVDRLNFAKTGPAKIFGNEIGLSSGRGGPLRTFATPSKSDDSDENNISAHVKGSKLSGAIFDAFSMIVICKARTITKLALGEYELPDPDCALSDDLLDTLAEKVGRIAEQFCAICIRALDYCPPVDIDFGDYLRALITADASLIHEDKWGYRGAIVEAFRKHDIYPYDVITLSENSLRWRPPQRPLKPISALSLQNLNFDGQPGIPKNKDSIKEQASIFGCFVSRDENYFAELGLRKTSGDVEPPEVMAVRPLTRVGPDGQVVFSLVAEIAQKQWVKMKNGKRLAVYGGATTIFDSTGAPQYIVRKRLNIPRWRKIQLDYAETAKRLKAIDEYRVEPACDALSTLCSE